MTTLHIINKTINELNLTKSKAPQRIINICAAFTQNILKKRERKEFYTKERGAPEKQIWNNKFFGKLGEFYFARYAHKILKMPGMKPDIKIYSSEEKKLIGFDPDLKYKHLKFHVKTHKISNRFPESYVFQNEDSILKNHTSNDLFVGVIIDDDYNCFLRCILPIEYVAKNLKAMVLSKHKNKSALYLDDIIKFKTDHDKNMQSRPSILFDRSCQISQ